MAEKLTRPEIDTALVELAGWSMNADVKAITNPGFRIISAPFGLHHQAEYFQHSTFR